MDCLFCYMKYTIKIQSVSDIITNSSSEVFICSTSGDPNEIANEVRQFLEDLMDLTGYSGDEYYEGADVTVASHDGEIYDWGEVSYKEGDILIESVTDNSIPYGIMMILEDLEYTPRFEGKITSVTRHHLG